MLRNALFAVAHLLAMLSVLGIVMSLYLGNPVAVVFYAILPAIVFGRHVWQGYRATGG